MSANNFMDFMEMHRRLLDCYAKTSPGLYREMSVLVQRDFCYTQRLQLEEWLIKQKVSPQDFFAAAKSEL